MLEVKDTNLYKGLAILGVLTIHTLAATSIDKADVSFLGVGSVVLDQLARFSVPMFVALSGYGLSRKYGKGRLAVGKFWWQRLGKLLPWYVAWSILSYLILEVLNVFGEGQGKYGLGEALLFGKADYQLYFVPMLLQLYLMYPMLRSIQKRIGSIKLLMLTMLVQAGSFWVYERMAITDQWQYTLFLPWVGYFGLGMVLASVKKFKLANKYWLLIGSGLAAGLVVAGSIWEINKGVDPIIATRFTRVMVMVYALMSILVLIKAKPYFERLPAWLSGPVRLAGKHSYLIFLSHTLVLRMVFVEFGNGVSLAHLITIAATSLLTLAVSPRMTG